MSDKSFRRCLTSQEHARLASLEAKLDEILDQEFISGDFGLLVSAAEVLEQKAFALRLEAANRGKLNRKKTLKRRYLGVYQGVFLI